MAKEIETKFKIASIAEFRKSLKRMGAKFVSKTLERDTYYKSPADNFCGGTIRLRAIGKRGVFTIKNPAPCESRAQYKVRDEFETAVLDAAAFGDILRRLGFKPWFRKEKIRSLYKWKSAKVTIDELPYIGLYAEIEGSKSSIKEAAKRLGLDMNKAIPDTYMKLFDYYRLLRKRKSLEFIF